ncbi:MAG TPA: MATE family efflux transporter, partial [Cellvibrio sp.]
MTKNITHSDVVRLAIPIILANMAAPLLGLVDTAMIGHTGNASDLGAIALGSLVFNFVYWAFGFLRMGTTGFVAQAAGADDYAEVRLAFGRALLLGGAIGLLLITVQYPLIYSALWLLDGSENVEAQVKTYWDIRIWAAPATLASYAIMGSLIGLGKTRQLLWLQLFLNLTNLALDVLFVAGFEWGVRGIA